MLAGAGVLPWILFALGLTKVYRPIFHSVGFRSMFHPLAEIEGFLTCFAVACLFTILPRRTATAPPAAWQTALALGAPVAIVICAALQKWVLGQIAWLLLIGMVTEFSLRRLRSQAAPRRLPPGSAWVAVALLMAAAGAILASAYEASGAERFWLHELGRSLLTQGLFTGLVLGIAGLLPTPGEGGAEPTAVGSGWAYLAHALGSALFFASFWVEQLVSQRLGFALRAAVTLAVVLQLVRAPPLFNKSGARGRALRTALWMLPLGNAWVALVPTSRRAGMHVIYLGCFAMLVLVVSTYHSLARRERADRQLDAPARQLGFGAACLALALGARILVEMDPLNFNLWLGIACASFVGATLFTFPSFPNRLLQLMHIDSAAGSPQRDDRT